MHYVNMIVKLEDGNKRLTECMICAIIVSQYAIYLSTQEGIMKGKPPFDTQDKRDDAHCAGRTGPKTKAKAKNMRQPPFKRRKT